MSLKLPPPFNKTNVTIDVNIQDNEMLLVEGLPEDSEALAEVFMFKLLKNITFHFKRGVSVNLYV